MGIEFSINGLICYLEHVWGELDDIQFELVDSSGDPIEDEEVYQFVETHHSDVLYEARYEQMIEQAEAYAEMQMER